MFAIIFMDIDMPEKDGFKTSAEILDILEENNLKTSICICSAFNGNSEK